MARSEFIGAAIPSLLRLQENVTDGLALTAEKHFTGAISTTGEPSSHRQAVIARWIHCDWYQPDTIC